MADRIETPTVTIAAGTAIAAAVTTTFTWNDGIVERFEVLVPPGPSGLVGFRIHHSGQQVIPFRSTDWIIADGESLSWDVQNYPTGNKWACRAYNLGIYPHSLYFRVHIRELPKPVVGPVAIIPVVPLAEQVVIE
jgi:hypothetical protein